MKLNLSWTLTVDKLYFINKKDIPTLEQFHISAFYMLSRLTPPREIKSFAQGHRAGNCQNWYLNPATLAPLKHYSLLPL